MAPQTITEKDTYAATFENEFQTSLRVLRAYPPDLPYYFVSPRSSLSFWAASRFLGSSWSAFS